MKYQQYKVDSEVSHSVSMLAGLCVCVCSYVCGAQDCHFVVVVENDTGGDKR